MSIYPIPICPKCSAKMILRLAKKGSNAGNEFWGCTKYPRCNGTLDLTVEQKSLRKQQVEIETSSDSKPEKKIDSPPPIPESRTELTEKQKKELILLKDRLLNLSSRNRSVKLSRLDAKWTFDLSQLNPLNEKLANDLIEFCLTKDGEIGILPKAKNEKDAELLKKLFTRLTHLERSINEIQREKGLYDLYVGFPFLSGIPAGSETVIQAPIFLVPVKLEKKTPKKGQIQWSLTVSKDNPPIFNKTLFLALSKLCNLKVNQSLFDEEIPDELYGDVTLIQKTHELLNEYGIITHMAEDALDKGFDKVLEFKNDEAGTIFQDGRLEIKQYAVLGHFPQSNSSIQRDYDSFLTMSQEELDGIVSFLEEYDHSVEVETKIVRDIGSPESSNIETIDHRPEKNNFFLLPSDSSQDKILLELDKNNKGIVIWGPPGTGKSQTIVNIIGDCLAKNKTVLLVSQKKAALDVVFDRVGTKGIDNLLGLVHDTKEDRKILYKKLSQEIAELKDSAGKQKKNLVDPSPEIENITSQLKEITKAYNDNFYGISLGELYRLIGEKQDSKLSLDNSWKLSNVEEVESAAMQISTLQGHGSVLSRTRYDEVRKSFMQIHQSEVEHFSSLVVEILEGETYKEASFIQSKNYSMTIKTNRVEDFACSINEFRRFTSPFKFFSPKWWRLRKIINEHKEFANSYLSNLALKVSNSFRHILHDNHVESILNQIRKGSFNDYEIEVFRGFVSNEFHRLKGFDYDYQKLPDKIKKIIIEIDKLVGDGQVPVSVDWGEYFKISVYSLWIGDLEGKYPIIAQIRSGRVESLRKRLNELLESKIDYSVHRLKNQYRDDLSNAKLLRDIANDVGKQRNVPSLRKLNEKFVENSDFRTLIPVWLASPEAVSDMFPLKKGMFDVVIFDEASQCTVEHGIPAIFRGKQIIIAGDEKQLPPSHLFESLVQDDNDEDDDSFATIEPSLLTLAKKNLHFQSHMLEWHYRSKHQELISFSNQKFYEGRMKVAPNVVPFKKGNKPAIEWISANGFWVNRCNEIEADEVIKRLRFHLEQDDPPTIGIITFNLQQKVLIQDKIDELEISDPEFAALLDKDKDRTDEKGKQLDRKFFVKNIENVQGDERDVIIFSIGYAKTDPNGRVYQRFGPIGVAGGENRLNVAVTRAIKKIEIVCSINPEKDLDTALSKNPGPKILKQYLCFSKAVAEEDFEKVDRILQEINPNLRSQGNSGRLHFDSPFEEKVYLELVRLGYEVHTQVGQSGFRIDQAIVHPANKDKYILGIECDGAMFHSGVSIRERDVFRQKFLEGRGWVIHRIWSTNWWDNKEAELQKIITKLDELKKSK